MVKRLLATAAALAIAWGPTSVRAGNFALVIGINQYEYAVDVPNLRYARPDAETIADLLNNSSSFPSGCVRLLTESQATRDAILHAFADLERQCADKGSASGQALVFFAGHAVGPAGSGGLDKVSGAESHEFLVPYDADPQDTYILSNGSRENPTFIKKEEFGRQLSRLSEQNISVIIDACHSDIPDLGDLMRLEIVDSQKRVGLLAASMQDSNAYEFPELRHGALSYAIIQTLYALRERTPRGQSVDVTMDNLYKGVLTVFSATEVGGRPLIGYNRPQLQLYPSVTTPIRFAAFTGSGEAVATVVARLEPISNGAPVVRAQAPQVMVAPPAAAPSPVKIVANNSAIPGAATASMRLTAAAPPPPNSISPAEPWSAAARAGGRRPVEPITPKPSPTPAVAVVVATPPSPPASPAPNVPGKVAFTGAIPPDAYLEVDGKVLTWSPGDPISLPSGSHIVVIGVPKYSYRSVSNVNVPAAGTVAIGPTFVGSLAIRSFKKADRTQRGPSLRITLDGQYLGDGNDLQRPNIAAGTHQLTITLYDTTRTTDVTIEPGSPLSVLYLTQAVARPAERSKVIPN